MDAMSISEIVKYVILGIFVLFALIGFFIGLARGAKKSSFRLLFFILSAGFAIGLTPIFSKLLFNQNFKIGSFNGSISSYIDQFISEQATVASILETSPVLQSFVNQLAYVVLNLITFLVLFLVGNFLGYILYHIFKAIFFKKKAQAWREDSAYQVELKKEKKHRLLGGLVGGLQSIAFLTLVFLPVSGFVSILNNLTYQKEAGSQAQYTSSAQLLQENLPEEVLEGISAYRNSPLGISSKILGTDTFMFDILTNIKVQTPNEKIKVSIRSEFYNFANLYNNLAFIEKIDFDNIVFKNLPYDKIENAVENVFESRLLRAVAPEVLNWIIEDINLPIQQSHLQIEIQPTYLNLINSIVDQYQTNSGIYNGLTNDLSTVLSVGMSAGKSGIVDEFMKPEIDLEAVKLALLANDREVVEGVFGKVFNAIALRVLAVDLLNQGLESVSTVDVLFTPVALQKVVWTDVNSELAYIVNNLIDMFVNVSSEFEGNLIQVIEENPFELLYADTNILTEKLGNIMSTLQNTNLLVDKDGDKVVYSQFMDYLNNTALNQYVDFNEFKVHNSWKNEMGHLNTLLNAVKNSGIISDVVNNIDTLELIDLNDVLSKLSKFDSTNSKTYTNNIVSAILESKAFSKMLNIGFDGLNDLIEENQSWLGDDVDLGKIQYERLNSQLEKNYITTFFDNFVFYANSIDLENLDSDPVKTIFSSNLSKLGLTLDAIKNSALFSEYDDGNVSHEGVYVALINALNSNPDFSTFADFTVAIDESFSWNNEFSQIQTLLDKMKDIQLQDKSLLDAIIAGDDLSDVFDYITESEIDEVIDPLVDSKLLAKNVAVFVNTVNEQIAELTGENIDDVASQDVILQKQHVKAVLKQMLSLSDILTGSVSEGTLKANAQDIGEFLNTLKQNSYEYESPVFGDTYNALVNYLKSDLTFGSKITALVDEYEDQEDIDWQELLNLFIEFEDQDISQGFSQEFTDLLSDIFATMKQDETYKQVVPDILTMMTDMSDIEDISDFKQILTAYANSLQTLADAQNAFADQQEYYNKTKTVFELFQELTGETMVEKFLQITIYQNEINSANTIAGIIDSVEAVDGNTTPAEMDVIADQMIDALGNSQLLLDLMMENDQSYEIENPALKIKFKEKIETSGFGLEKQADLKQFFNITD